MSSRQSCSCRGIATSLVPFFRTIGGSLGVGALGGILAAGLHARLGAAAETAGAILAGTQSPGRAPAVAPALFRDAIEGSLLPVFIVLAALAVANVVVASLFPLRRPAPDHRVRAPEALG